MSISLAQFFAIFSIGYLCGLSLLSGFSLAVAYKLFIENKNSKLRDCVWTFFACLGIATSTLGTLFAIILLVIANDTTSEGFFLRATIFIVALTLGATFSVMAAKLFNSAVRSGKIKIAP